MKIHVEHPPLAPRDLLPPFEGRALDGRVLPFEELWQHRNLVLFAIPADVSAAGSVYLNVLESRLLEMRPSDTSLVIVNEAIDGVPLGRLVIADRWGEIAHVAELSRDPSQWPPVEDIVEWVDFIRSKCEECPPM